MEVRTVRGAPWDDSGPLLARHEEGGGACRCQINLAGPGRRTVDHLGKAIRVKQTLNSRADPLRGVCGADGVPGMDQELRTDEYLLRIVPHGRIWTSSGGLQGLEPSPPKKVLLLKGRNKRPFPRKRCVPQGLAPRKGEHQPRCASSSDRRCLIKIYGAKVCLGLAADADGRRLEVRAPPG